MIQIYQNFKNRISSTINFGSYSTWFSGVELEEEQANSECVEGVWLKILDWGITR